MAPTVPQIVALIGALEDDPAHAVTLDGSPFQIFVEAVARGLVEAPEQDAFAHVVGKAVARGLIGFERTQAGSRPTGAIWGSHDFQIHSGYHLTAAGRQFLASTVPSPGVQAARSSHEAAGTEGADLRDCFISHAGEDKNTVARPLAEALIEAGYSVWFDEYELVLGDSLRERIDQGLARSRFGVVVLSESFFEKRWPQGELNALIAREMAGGERLILPIWHEIDEGYLVARSPLLADRIGVPSAPIKRAAEQVARAIERREGAGPAATRLLDTAAPSPTVRPAPLSMVESGIRVRLELTDAERELYANEGGHPAGPGWLSIVVGPVELRPDLIDPLEVPLDRLRGVQIADPWYDTPLNPYLRVDHRGFWARLPEGEDAAPAYWMRIWDDGLMEYGYELSRKASPTNPEPELVVPTTSVAELIHDNTLLFLTILAEVGYVGEAVALATFNHLDGHFLGVDNVRHGWQDTTLQADRVDGRPLQGLVPELVDQVGSWTKKTMDRLFLGAGLIGGYGEIDSAGNRLDRAGHRY